MTKRTQTTQRDLASRFATAQVAPCAAHEAQRNGRAGRLCRVAMVAACTITIASGCDTSSPSFPFGGPPLVLAAREWALGSTIAADMLSSYGEPDAFTLSSSDPAIVEVLGDGKGTMVCDAGSGFGCRLRFSAAANAEGNATLRLRNRTDMIDAREVWVAATDRIEVFFLENGAPAPWRDPLGALVGVASHVQQPLTIIASHGSTTLAGNPFVARLDDETICTTEREGLVALGLPRLDVGDHTLTISAPDVVQTITLRSIALEQIASLDVERIDTPSSGGPIVAFRADARDRDGTRVYPVHSIEWTLDDDGYGRSDTLRGGAPLGRGEPMAETEHDLTMRLFALDSTADDAPLLETSMRISSPASEHYLLSTSPVTVACAE